MNAWKEKTTTSRAVAHLRHGGLLIYPTETAYALGCDATNAHAVASIFRLKGRERGKSFPLIVASRAMAERYARFTPLARRLAKRYWPGPLTLVLSTDDGTIALRVSSHPIARALSRALGRPIVSTSANRSGQPPCYTTTSALSSLGHGADGETSGVDRETPDVELAPTSDAPAGAGGASGEPAPMLRSLKQMLVLNIGPLPRRRPSTIVDARGDALRTLRRGTIRV